MSKKLNEEQLARVLQAHKNGQLVRCGGSSFRVSGRCCLYQAALQNDYVPLDIAKGKWNKFDDAYDKSWTEAQFLSWMTANGIV